VARNPGGWRFAVSKRTRTRAKSRGWRGKRVRGGHRAVTSGVPGDTNHDALYLNFRHLPVSFSIVLKRRRARALRQTRRPAGPAMPDRSLPDPPPRGERWFRTYKTFVRRNRSLLTAVEQGVAGLTWLVPDGAHTEIIAEAASSFVGVVSTLNDHLVGEEDGLWGDDSGDDFVDALEEVGDDQRSELDDFGESSGETSGSFAGDSAGEFEEARSGTDQDQASTSGPGTLKQLVTQTLEKWDKRTYAFLEAVPVSLCLGILSQVEVLNEMLSKRRVRNSPDKNEEDSLNSVLCLETARAILKTTLWSRNNGRLLLDDGLSPDQGESEQSFDSFGNDETKKPNAAGVRGVSALPPGERRAALALHALYQFRVCARRTSAGVVESSAGVETDTKEKRRGQGEGEGETFLSHAEDSNVSSDGSVSAVPEKQPHETPRSTLGLPDVPTSGLGFDGISPVPLPPLGLTLLDASREDRARLTLKLVGEACHILRPLLYVSSMKKHGRKSWKPVLVSASLDVTMFVCLAAAAGSDDQQNFTTSEQHEMKRRRASLAYYAMRSPVFEKVTAPVLRGGGYLVKPIPLLNGLYQKGVDIARDVNDHFAYTY
jgi:hypothetical protein